MIGIRSQSSPEGDTVNFGDLRARGTFDALEVDGAVQVNASSGDVANASCAASLPAVAGRMNYLHGFSFTFTGATAAGSVVATLTGLQGGTVSYVVAAPAGAQVAGTPIHIQFAKPRRASAANTAITFTCGALGAGNLHACANIHGWHVEAS